MVKEIKFGSYKIMSFELMFNYLLIVTDLKVCNKRAFVIFGLHINKFVTII